jgi:hypothetical protein
MSEEDFVQRTQSAPDLFHSHDSVDREGQGNDAVGGQLSSTGGQRSLSSRLQSHQQYAFASKRAKGSLVLSNERNADLSTEFNTRNQELVGILKRLVRRYF